MRNIYAIFYLLLCKIALIASAKYNYYDVQLPTYLPRQQLPNTISQAVLEAWAMIISADRGVLEVLLLSLKVSLSATMIASIAGLAIGLALATYPFAGRGAFISILNTLLGLPSVVVGLLVYILLSRAGPLGSWGLLFTPTAMVIAQTLLITPLVAALSRQAFSQTWLEFEPLLKSLGLPAKHRAFALLHQTRWALLTIILAALGRAISEVGAVMIVGGNIAGVTRVMTTSITLETSKGEISIALALGFILLGTVLMLNFCASLIQREHTPRSLRIAS